MENCIEEVRKIWVAGVCLENGIEEVRKVRSSRGSSIGIGTA